MKATLVIPSYNNLRHLKNCYTSIRKHYPEVELILMDDGSSDGTWEWLTSLVDAHARLYKSPTRVGHTILYDKGIKLSTHEVVGILHADMIVARGYLENLIKHLDRKRVVCATRVEPPLHGPGPDKIIEDFGQDFDSLDVEGFEDFAQQLQSTHSNEHNPGMFAPWIIHKEDFLLVGGHDWGFAPFPIFQRWLLAGYQLIQSRDSYVYHLTCRGHRWTEEVGKDDFYFKECEKKARQHYIKKWGSWIKNDPHHHPILIPVYNKKLVATNFDGRPSMCVENPDLPRATPKMWTSEKLRSWVHLWFNGGEDVIVEMDGHAITPKDLEIIPQINSIVKDIGQTGSYQVHNLKLIINDICDRSASLIHPSNDD